MRIRKENIVDPTLYREFHRRFEYDDGVLRCKIKVKASPKVGEKVGYVGGSGYLQCKCNGRIFTVHQIVFMMHHGFIPPLIDHIDRDKHNNKIDNLRACTDQENQFNKGANANNVSCGIRGVTWVERRKVWRAQMKYNGKQLYFGHYKTLEEAHKARIDAEIAYGVESPIAFQIGTVITGLNPHR